MVVAVPVLGVVVDATVIIAVNVIDVGSLVVLIAAAVAATLAVTVADVAFAVLICAIAVDDVAACC